MSTNELVSLYGSLYGSLYFATVMSTAFYGVTCMQSFFYYVHYQKDPLRVKIFVASLWTLNTIHEALTVSGSYKSIMAGLYDPLSYVSGNPELVLLFLFTVLVSIPTQGFFVYRIYLFSEKNLIAPIIWVVLALVQLVCSVIYVQRTLYSGIVIPIVAVSALDSSSVMSLATFCLAVAAGVDVLIAMFMTFLLIRKRAATDFARTAHVLQRLTVFAVNTGIWTATFALLSIILLHIFPTNLIWTVFSIPLCSIYCNTLLGNLNARAYIQGEMVGHNIDLDLFSTSASSQLSNSIRFHKQPASGEATLLASTHSQRVWKTTEVVTHSEVNQSITVEIE